LKDTLKRRRPDFSETYYGFRTFGNLLEEAQTRGLFEFGRDEKSGTYVFRSAQAIEALGGGAETEPLPVVQASPVLEAGDELAAETQGEQPSEMPRSGDPAAAPAREPRRRGGRGRKGREPATEEKDMASWPAPTPDLVEADESAAAPAAAQPEAAEASQAIEAAPEAAAEQPAAPVKERRRAPRKPAAKKGRAAQAAPEAGADNAAIGLDAAAAVATPVVDTVSDLALAALADVDTGTDADAGAITDADPSDPAPEDAQAGKPERKKSSRPAHKAPSRKPATRARRPAKPKTPEGA
jgi:hypothetical protein